MLKTMVANIRVDNSQIAYVAKGNALTNFCLSKNMLNKLVAYEFSTVAAEFMDLVVFDIDYYKTAYENTILGANEEHQRSAAGAAQACQKLENDLPVFTVKLSSRYREYARELGVARSEENQRIAQSMSNFRVPNTPIPQMNFPNIQYSQEQSHTQNFLVNTKSGLTQCRITKSNFVFCL